jgi:hypothetical protein
MSKQKIENENVAGVKTEFGGITEVVCSSCFNEADDLDFEDGETVMKDVIKDDDPRFCDRCKQKLN